MSGLSATRDDGASRLIPGCTLVIHAMNGIDRRA